LVNLKCCAVQGHLWSCQCFVFAERFTSGFSAAYKGICMVAQAIRHLTAYQGIATPDCGSFGVVRPRSQY